MTTTTDVPRLNGVDTATLFATLDAVKGQHEIAKFQFRASNTWVNGTHSRSTIGGFYGAMQEMQHKAETVVDGDHPAVLVGDDNAPTPVEYPLPAPAGGREVGREVAVHSMVGRCAGGPGTRALLRGSARRVIMAVR